MERRHACPRYAFFDEAPQLLVREPLYGRGSSDIGSAFASFAV